MNRYDFLQKILTQLNEVQVRLNAIYAMIKEQLKDEQNRVPSET